jgi:Na+/glutamate symporter
LLSSSFKKLKSVGAQLSARLLFSAQILAIQRKLALASAQFLAED